MPVVSELFTNAVKYWRPGDASVRVALEIGDTRGPAEVGDHGRGVEERDVSMPDEDAETGEGSPSWMRLPTAGA